MNIPGLGDLTRDERFGWYCSQPTSLSLLNGSECKIVVEGYDEDPCPLEFHAAIANLLACEYSVLKAAEPYVFRYYQDVNANWDTSVEEFVLINTPSDVWSHIQIGRELMVMRRPYGDEGIYVSIECHCDWEREHGLQIVLKNGEQVVKVGPYDGHLTNSDAYADESLENVIYR